MPMKWGCAPTMQCTRLDSLLTYYKPSIKEDMMKNIQLNYEKLINVTKSLSRSKDPDEIIAKAVDSIQMALGVKGCALFLMNGKTKELEVAAATGLSDEYLNKGALSALQSIADSLKQGPVTVFDVSDDPRIQYPEAAQKEGIASILSVPVLVGDDPIGAMRVYTAEKWDFTLDDVNFVQALAQIAGILIEMSRLYKGQAEYIDVLSMRCESPSL
jgi:GAF domain-containing protein